MSLTIGELATALNGIAGSLEHMLAPSLNVVDRRNQQRVVNQRGMSIENVCCQGRSSRMSGNHNLAGAPAASESVYCFGDGLGIGDANTVAD